MAEPGALYLSPPRQQHLPAAAASLGVVALLGWALVSGLTVSNLESAVAPLVSVVFTAPPKPPEPPRERPKPVHETAAKGAQAPRNIRNKATQVVAPVIPPLIVPPPIIAAPKAGVGSASNNGASNRIGTGQGAGGTGNGLGGGGDGGDGAGDVAPEQIGGRLKPSDLPADIVAGGRGGDVDVRYAVGVDGRVSDCRIDHSSGLAELDALTCRLIEQRFRFRPSRDGAGQAVRSTIVETHSWSIDRTPEERDRG